MKYSYPNSKDNENENKQPNCQIQYDTSDVLTLEGLRRNYNSCSDCGVCWYDDHVNLDCSECGGYAMCRPCAKCNGQCGAMWKRDVTASHLNKKAAWVGSCSLDFQWNSTSILDSNTLSGEDNKNANNLENSYLHISPKSKAYA